MARQYANPATEDRVSEAQQRLDAAREQLRSAEAADPLAAGWEARYERASTAVRACERRLTALETLRAAQLERGGQRDAAVQAAAKELAATAKSLAASRDQVAGTWAVFLKAAAALQADSAAHNGNLSAARSMLAAKGLAVRDDLVDVDSGAEHAEGSLDSGGVRLGGVDWTPVNVKALIVHALVEATGKFHGPFSGMRGSCPPHQVTSRPDQLAVPVLAQAGPAAAPAAGPQRPTIEEGRRREPGSD